jgi:anti-sigma factor RsiW/copper chaperone CopZ
VNLPSCPGFEPLLERFADGECPEEESLHVREHLAACPACRAGLRSTTDLSRRVAQSPAPPVPALLEARLRAALDRARPPRAWIPAAAAAVLLAGAALLLRGSATPVPNFVVATAAVHDAFLAGGLRVESPPSPDELRAYFRRVLDADVAAPGLDDGTCVGGCPCTVAENQAPWILYRRGDTPISLLLVEDGGGSFPPASRRELGGRIYHVFRVRDNTVLVCAAGSAAHVWIARLPEKDLVACALETREGRDAFAGEKIPIRDVVCRACCARAEDRAKRIEGVDDAKVSLHSMEILVTGKKKLDLDRVIRELKEAGVDVRAK